MHDGPTGGIFFGAYMMARVLLPTTRALIFYGREGQHRALADRAHRAYRGRADAEVRVQVVEELRNDEAEHLVA